MRCAFAIALVGCGSTPAPVANTAPPPDVSWNQRALELCAPLGGDANRGLAAVTLAGVTVGAEIPATSGYSGGYSRRAWMITSPAPLHALGIGGLAEGHATPNGWHLGTDSRITAVWIETNIAVAELCAALELPVVANKCSRTDGDHTVMVWIDKVDTQLGCYHRKS